MILIQSLSHNSPALFTQRHTVQEFLSHRLSTCGPRYEESEGDMQKREAGTVGNNYDNCQGTQLKDQSAVITNPPAWSNINLLYTSVWPASTEPLTDLCIKRFAQAELIAPNNIGHASQGIKGIFQELNCLTINRVKIAQHNSQDNPYMTVQLY